MHFNNKITCSILKNKRSIILTLSILLTITNTSCFRTTTEAGNGFNKQNEMEHTHTNELIHQTSPYLLQHAHNPVNWYAWGEKALAKAASEDKLILVSIGYSACHWCHVMERESFENQEVADLMNEHFVCIKVDREERPDVDQVYMNAVQITTGSGGWPLNCFALPDGRPVYGGTYFPKQNWMQILKSLATMYQNERGKLHRSATDISKGIAGYEVISVKEVEQEYTKTDLDNIVNPWKKQFDTHEGGNKRAPKFPLPGSWSFLLEYAHTYSDSEVLEQLELTLDKIALGGIYDQVGGGFARYSVDAQWKVPHFEKMLYDNGQLVSLYSQAYKATQNPFYKQVIAETLGFVSRELLAPEGGFYSALDADSDGVEGLFYIWTQEAFDAVLGADAHALGEYYGINAGGNWDHGANILMAKSLPNTFAVQNGFTEAGFNRMLQKAKTKLLKAREAKVRPGLDDKILTSWNALMITGFVNAYEATGEPEYLLVAEKAADFLFTKMMASDFSLKRNYKNGKATINAFAEDYGLLAQASLALYSATFNESYLDKAKGITEFAIAHFFDTHSGMFWYTSDIDPALAARKMELSDNVIASSNAIIARVLQNLAVLIENHKYADMSVQMLHNMKATIPKSGAYYYLWASVMLKNVASTKEIVISGKNAMKLRKEIAARYLPNTILAGSITKSELPLLQNRFVKNTTNIYICENKTCKLPVTTVKEALEQIFE